MKYRPSGNFLLSVGLLILSFFVMQGVVVPSIVRKELGAQALSSRATQSKASTVSGVLLEEHYDELDPHTNQLVIKNQKFYLDTGTGNPTPITVANKSIAESLVNEKVTYKTSNKSLDLDVSATRPITESVSSRESRENIGRDVTPRPGVGTREGKAAVFLVNFESNERQIPVPLQNPRDIEDYLFDERKGQFQKFFSEVSHGKVSYTGDVFGWYTMPGYGSDAAYQGYLGPCTVPYSSLQNMVNNINIADYNTIIILSRCGDYGTIGGYASEIEFSGQEYYFTEIKGHPTRFDFTGSSDYVNYPSYVGILNHEIGHTFGLGHSNSLDCDEKTVWSDCSISYYGNAFDTMGYPDGARAYNYRQQLKLGWINSDNVLVINQPGSYHLDNLQTPGGVVGAQIYMPNRTAPPIFGLEHRKAEGVDSKLQDTYLFGNIPNGLLLYTAVNPDNYQDPNATPFYINNYSWNIADPHPEAGLGIYQDLHYDAITETNGFYDPVTGIGINVTGVTADGIDFNVYYDFSNSVCNPNISIDDVINVSASTGVISSSTFSIQLDWNLSGDSMCPWKKYELNVPDAMTSEWITNETTFTGNPGNTFYAVSQSPGTHSLTAMIPGGTLSGLHELIFIIKDLDTLEEKEFIVPINYVNLVEDCVAPIEGVLEVFTMVDGVDSPHTTTVHLMDGESFIIKLNRQYLPPVSGCPNRNYQVQNISQNITDWAVTHPSGFPSIIAEPNSFTTTSWEFLVPSSTNSGSHQIEFKVKDLDTLEEKEFIVPVSVHDSDLCQSTLEIFKEGYLDNGSWVQYDPPPYIFFSDMGSIFTVSYKAEYSPLDSNCPNNRTFMIDDFGYSQAWANPLLSPITMVVEPNVVQYINIPYNIPTNISPGLRSFYYTVEDLTPNFAGETLRIFNFWN